MKRITQTQFIKEYCESSKITEKKLNALGQLAVVCDCGEEGCRGWAMVSKEFLPVHLDLYIKKNEDT